MKTKKDAIAAAAAVGLPTQGTKAEIEARLAAWEEATADTAAAVNAPGTPEESPSPAKPFDPLVPALIGGAIAIADHLIRRM